MINFIICKVNRNEWNNKTKSKNCYIFNFMQAYLHEKNRLKNKTILKVHNFVVHKVVNLVFFNYICSINKYHRQWKKHLYMVCRFLETTLPTE